VVGPADTASPDKPALVSREELIGLVVDPKLLQTSADQVPAHMGRLGQVRRTQSQASLDFNVGTAERVDLEYVPTEHGGWAFSRARVSLPARDTKAQASLYTEVNTILQKRFGKPAWIDPDKGLLQHKGWSVGRRDLEVSLWAGNDETGRVVELEFGEVQGEAE